MEHISTLLPKRVEDLARPTKVEAISTPASVKFESDFQTLNDPKLVTMLTAAEQFVAALEQGIAPHWISFVGPSGIGKTHLAKAIGRHFREHLRYYREPARGALCVHPGGYTVSWRKLSAQFRGGEWGRLEDASEEYLLVLDDIGSEHDTPFIKSKLDELLALRVKKWTVITSNFTLEQINNRIDPRIASRMLRDGSVVVDSDAIDWNLRR